MKIMNEANTGTEAFQILRMKNAFSILTQYMSFLCIEKLVIKAQV